ncbi:MAG: hypothetical protein ACLPYS_08175 [Vulcanimicrobiaceae bacterium]
MTALCFQQGGTLLAAADEAGLVPVWDPPRSALPVAAHRLDSAACELAWLCRDTLLAAVTSQGSVRVFSVPGSR